MDVQTQQSRLTRYKDLGFVFMGRGSSAMGGLLLTFVVANRFSIEETGRFMLAFAVLMTAGFIGRFGLDVLAIKELPAVRENQAAQKESIGHFLGLSFLFALGLACLSLVISKVFEVEALQLAVLGIFPFSLINLQGAILRALGRTRVGAFCEAGLSAVFASLIIFIAPTIGFATAWLYVCGFAWLQMLLVLALMGRSKLIELPKHVAIAKLWKKTKPFGFIQVASNIAQWGGLYLVAVLATDADVALANALFRFVAPFQFLFLTLDFYLGPQFSTFIVANRNSENRHSALLDIRRFGIGVALVLSLLMLATLALAGPQLFAAFFPKDYAGLFWPLMLLFLAHALVLGLGQNGLILSLSGHVDIVLKATLLRATIGLTALVATLSVFQIWAVATVYSVAIILEAIYFRLKVDTIYDKQP